MFQQLREQRHLTLDYSFTSLEPLNPVEALHMFLDECNVECDVDADLGSLVFFTCEDYDFQIVIEAGDQGDCYTHGIYVYVNDGDPKETSLHV